MNSELLRRRPVILLITLFACTAQPGCDALLGAEGRIERVQAALETADYVASIVDAKAASESEPGNVIGRFLLARRSRSRSLAQVANPGMSTGT